MDDDERGGGRELSDNDRARVWARAFGFSFDDMLREQTCRCVVRMIAAEPEALATAIQAVLNSIQRREQ